MPNRQTMKAARSSRTEYEDQAGLGALLAPEPGENGHCANLKKAEAPVIGTVAEPAPNVPGTLLQLGELRLMVCCS